MFLKKLILALAFALFVTSSSYSQLVPGSTPPPAAPVPKIADTLALNLEKYGASTETPREKREQAYAKLMEAQRYIWRSNPMRPQPGQANNMRLAREALQRAVELDPTLAEAYTALAELAITSPPNDVEEAISLAMIATKLEPNNFGGHRILARLYTYKSRLTTGSLDSAFAAKAISEWNEVVRLDPRNAEGWAFLSAFYEETGKSDEQIEALRKWVASATPLETQFFRRVMGGRESLSPESASMKLGPALMKAGRSQEAVEVLSLVVADEPENNEAVELLREAIESADTKTAAAAVESLQQAAFANPANVSLVGLLAQVHARAGKFDEATKVLQGASERLTGSDKTSASSLQVSLGDIYAGADRHDEAVKAYESALTLRGITGTALVEQDEREFVMAVFEKIIQVHKNANQPAEAKSAIDRARKLLGKDDLFADRQLISFYRETGNKAEALTVIRTVRTRMPADYGFLRLEASLLADLGRVDEAVALVKSLLKKPVATGAPGIGSGSGTLSVTPALYDDFSNYLFISQLYNQANRGKEAIEAANQAFTAARGVERKQIARLTLATAQQMSKDFGGAETTLRDILKQSPGNPIAMNNLGYFLLERDERIDEAFKLIQQAVQIDPTNPSYLDSLGWAYFKQGKYADAERYLKDAGRYDSASSTIQEHLGDVYQKQGKADQSKAAWQRALTLAADPADIARLKGKLALGTAK